MVEDDDDVKDDDDIDAADGQDGVAKPEVSIVKW